MPPVERARIADFANPPEPNRLLQANMQSWHPTHRSESTTSRRVNFGIFLFISFFTRIVKSSFLDLVTEKDLVFLIYLLYL
jgi:hypothetical protein